MAAAGGLSLAPPAQGTSSYRIPSTIAGDCSVNVAPALRAWIASVPNDSLLDFGKGACYRIDGTLEVTNRRGLVFDGNGATFKATTTGHYRRSQWRLVGGSRLLFRNMTVRGGSPVGGSFVPDLQHQHAFDLRGAEDVEIAHADVFDVYGDCVYIGQGLNRGKSWSSDVHVHDSTCTRNGRMGVAVTAGRGVLVEKSTFTHVARTAFDVEPNGAGFGAQDITFRSNRAVGALPGGFFTALGHGPVDSVTVADNTVTGAGMYIVALAPPGQRRSDLTFSGNWSDTGHSAPGSAAVKAERVDRLTVTRNTVPLSAPHMALVSVVESCSFLIFGNRFPGGIVEARTPDSCRAQPSAARRTHTATTLRLSRAGRRAGPGRRGRVRISGRVRGSNSGMVVVHLHRFNRSKQRWRPAKTRLLRVGRHGRFSKRLGGLTKGRWRAKATFRGTGDTVPSASPYRRIRIG